MKKDKLAILDNEIVIQDIEQEIPQSESWIRKMERLGHLNIKAPKVRGQVKRLFDRSDFANVLHVSAYSSVGYGPQKLDHYKSLVKNFRKYITPFLKKLFKDPDDQFFLFSSRDVFPDGDPENLDWGKLGTEEGNIYLDPLKALHLEAQVLMRVTRNTQKSLEKVEKDLDDFINSIEDGLKRTLSGQMYLGRLDLDLLPAYGGKKPTENE